MLSLVLLFAIPWTAACKASLSITNCWSPPKPMSIELVMPPNHLILCRPLLLLPSIFPSNRSFQMSQFFASGGQSIGALASASVLQKNIQDWFYSGLTGWISLQSKWLSRVFSLHSSKVSIIYLGKTKNWIHRILIFQSFCLLNIIIEKALKSKAISEKVTKLNVHLH